MSLTVERISYAYEPGRPVLNEISFEIEDGSVAALLGPNGIGKTTLMKNILLLLRPSGGSCRIDGQRVDEFSPKALARQIAYVPQKTQVVFSMRVFDFVDLGAAVPFRGQPAVRRRAWVESVLERFDLTHLAFKDLSRMSGGEQQRVFLARGMAQRPRVLLLDEPTSNMDLRYQKQTFEQLRQAAQSMDISLLIAIHDLNLSARYCDYFVLIQNGRVFKTGRQPDIYRAEILEAVYDVPVQILPHDLQPVVILA